MSNISIVIVEKLGSLKSMVIKEYLESDLYKKCGFKKVDGFSKQTEWGIKLEGKKYIVAVFAKTDGKSNTENKYDFPPPIDTVLFFGNCALVCSIKSGTEYTVISLSLDMWTKMYEKLFGGFEDLAATAKEDAEEEDELDGIPDSKKTKHGYLKDGFVVDSSDTEYETEDEDEEEEEGEEESEDLEIEDIGSELSEDEYESGSDTE
jgi:hypothetical protein